MYYIGQLVVAAGISKNNRNTVVPFAIPAGILKLRLLASGADCYVEIERSVDTALATTAAQGVSIGTTEYFMGLPDNSDRVILAAFNNNAASRNIDVWACFR